MSRTAARARRTIGRGTSGLGGMNTKKKPKTEQQGTEQQENAARRAAQGRQNPGHKQPATHRSLGQGLPRVSWTPMALFSPIREKTARREGPLQPPCPFAGPASSKEGLAPSLGGSEGSDPKVVTRVPLGFCREYPRRPASRPSSSHASADGSRCTTSSKMVDRDAVNQVGARWSDRLAVSPRVLSVHPRPKYPRRLASRPSSPTPSSSWGMAPPTSRPQWGAGGIRIR